MSRTFLYTRVSTADQTTENQRLLAEQAGYKIDARRVHAEVISGTVPAMNPTRKGPERPVRSAADRTSPPVRGDG